MWFDVEVRECLAEFSPHTILLLFAPLAAVLLGLP
jgi:hypothetical protein